MRIRHLYSCQLWRKLVMVKMMAIVHDEGNSEWVDKAGGFGPSLDLLRSEWLGRTLERARNRLEWGHCAELRTDKQGRALCTQIHLNMKKWLLLKWRKQAAQISLNKMCIGVSPSLKRNCHIWHTVHYSTWNTAFVAHSCTKVTWILYPILQFVKFLLCRRMVGPGSS